MVPLRGVAFVKAHALGNDFLIVRDPDAEHLVPESLASTMCDRHAGVGADGLVLIGPAPEAGTRFRIFNADGSEAQLSGNGLRCAAAVLARWTGERRFVFETRAGQRELNLEAQRGSEWIFRAEMGRPSFSAAAIPFRPPRPLAEPILAFPLPVGDVTVAATILSMGNPQCIVFREDPAMDWQALGADLERHPFFPDRANIGFVRVLGRDRIEARFWERGAGHTLASGTGACACAVAANLAGHTGRKVTVEVERGRMEVWWRDDGMVDLIGPAEITVEGVHFYDATAATATEGGR